MFQQKLNNTKSIALNVAYRVLIAGIGLLLICLIVFNEKQVVFSAPSNSLNFQARLYDTNGNIVPDGNYHIEFKLYNSLAAGASAQGSCVGGATDDCVWMETRTTGNLVSVKGGYFSVSLGDVTAFPDINWDQELFLTMNIGGAGGAASYDGEMSPRIKLTAVPYAFQANTARELEVENSGFTGNLAFDTLTADRNILLPNASGTLLTNQSGFVQNGNSFTQNAVLGTNDNYSLAFETNNVTRLTIDTSGNASLTGNLTVDGTGTSSFAGALEVDGNITLGDAAVDTVTINAASVTYANASDITLANVVDSLNFDSNTLSIDALNNRVGIGTAAPESALHIAGTVVDTLKLEGAATNALGISLDNTDAGSNEWQILSSGSSSSYGLENGAFAIKSAGSGTFNAFTIGPSGQAGFGTNSYNKDFNVSGTSIFSPRSGAGLTGSNQQVLVSVSGETHAAGTSAFKIETGYRGQFAVNADTGYTGIGQEVATNPLSVSPVQYDGISQSASQSGTTVTGVGTSFTSALIGSEITWRETGDKAIVTAVGSATSMTVDRSQTVAAGGFRIHYIGLQVDATGNVGIGTTNPNARLDVVTDASDGSYGLRIENTTAGGEFVQLVNSLGNTVLEIDQTGSSQAVLRMYNATDNTIGVSLQYNGDSYINLDEGYAFGIGTNAPTARLHAETDTGDNLTTLIVTQDDTTNNNVALQVTNSGTGNSFEVVDTGASTVLSVGATGNVLFQNSVNSQTSFRILSQGGNKLLTADTIANKVAFGPHTDGDILGQVQITPDAAGTRPNLVLRETSGNSGDFLQTWDASGSNVRTRINVLGGAVFNEQGLDTDFRVEGDTDVNLLMIDGSADKVSIGAGATPDVKLHVNGGGEATLANGSGYLAIGTITGANLVFDANEIQARSNGAAASLLLQEHGGNVGIGSSGPDRKLDVLDTTNPQLRLTHTDGSVYTDLQTTSAGYLNIVPTGTRINIGTIDATATLLVMDTKTTAGDPTGVDGAIYYNSNAGSFRCYSDGVWGDCGKLPRVAYFEDNTSDSLSNLNESIWDGTLPNITLDKATDSVVISINIFGTGAGTDHEYNVFSVSRAIDANPTCSSTEVGTRFVGLTTDDGGFGDDTPLGANITFRDAPGAAGNARYIVCHEGGDSFSSGNSSNINNVVQEITVTLQEGSS